MKTTPEAKAKQAIETALHSEIYTTASSLDYFHFELESVVDRRVQVKLDRKYAAPSISVNLFTQLEVDLKAPDLHRATALL